MRRHAATWWTCGATTPNYGHAFHKQTNKREEKRRRRDVVEGKPKKAETKPRGNAFLIMHALREQKINLQSQNTAILSTLRKQNEIEAQPKALDEREKTIAALEKVLMKKVEAEMRAQTAGLKEGVQVDAAEQWEYLAPRPGALLTKDLSRVILQTYFTSRNTAVHLTVNHYFVDSRKVYDINQTINVF